MIGQTLGHYKVGEQLGRGGMGEVYTADDLNLNRKVALKFLPDAFTGDPERMARFEREAKLLASLNHPSIAAIYGLEQAEGKRFIVMELVEGETLAQRLGKGALPIDESLGICKQIAEGLEAAHEKGVIHRDLKPANVMITEGDKVKILDFGLAKTLSGETQIIDSSHSPTITEAMTQPGIVLGTAAYMSPEQAKGKAVDKRADIWAFGCILYECLTAKRAFAGETVTETLAAILKSEPNWQALPVVTPQSIKLVLRHCLEKDISLRFRDIADVQIVTGEARDAGQGMTPAKHQWLAWGVAALCLLVAALALLSMNFRRKLAVAEPMKFAIAVPDRASLGPGRVFALSPNGRHLVFSAIGSDGIQRLWLRTLGSLETRTLTGAESFGFTSPFWSPDSRFIAFDAGERLKRIDVSSGPSQTICNVSGQVIGGSWNLDGVIVFGTFGGSIMSVSASGGAASPLTKLNYARRENGHYYPSFLPDGRHFLYYISSQTPENRGVYVGSLDYKPEEHNARQLIASSQQAIYVPPQDSRPGQLLFLREQTLVAQRFDDKRLVLVGEPIPVAEHVGSFPPYGFFSASTNDTLVYRSGSDREAGVRAIWFDRQGKALGEAGESTLNLGLSLSPNGLRAVASWRSISQDRLSIDLWLLDFGRDTNTRFTFGQGVCSRPVWSHDGSRIIFASTRGGAGADLYQKLSTGAKEEELLLKSNEDKYPTSCSGDGRFLLYVAANPKTRRDLWVLPLEGDRKPIPFLRTDFNESDGRFSPDMRWIAYQSDESGSNEIYVQAFSPGSGAASLEMGGKWLISKGGGAGPRWRGDGKELYYRTADGKVMAVEIAAGSGAVLQPGTPKALFQAAPSEAIMGVTGQSFWDVTADGNRFLLVLPAMESAPAPFIMVLNWTALLKK